MGGNGVWQFMHQTLLHFGKAFLLGASSSIKHIHTHPIHLPTLPPRPTTPRPSALGFKFAHVYLRKNRLGRGTKLKMHLLNKPYPSPTPIPRDYFGLEISQYTVA